MKIENNKFVSVTYNLIVGEEEGKATVMETASADRPLAFIPGLDMMLPKFEENLIGREQGEKFDFIMTPEDAYGQPDPNAIVDIPLDIFKNDKGKVDYKEVAVDHTLPMMDQDGNVHHGTIVRIEGDKVTMDFNHPLAGETLHFVGEVIEVREATAEEMARATQPQSCGCGGCGGGCGSNGEGGCGGGCGDKKGGCCGK